MDAFEMEDGTAFSIENDVDLCSSILSRFSSSAQEEHQHLCAAIGAMSQELKDQNLPLTPISYFGATCSSLDRLLSSPDPDRSSHIIGSLSTILSLLLPKISVAVLKKKGDFLTDLVVRVVRLSSVTAGAVASGLTCLSRLLTGRGRVNWSDVSQLYGVVLAFMTDSRLKVRRQSHLCVREILLSLQGTLVLAPASEAITNMFEKFLLLAGGSNTSADEKPKGAQEVLYVLDALKECLPLMSTKYTAVILKYFKTLLELRQLLVTRRVTDALNVICLHPTLEVSAEALLDLLCSLALSVSTNETSADAMTFTARLLNVGMIKIYSINREICSTKLPIVFNALKDILASEHEEAIFAATEALKNLINACIDESLIKQGVDQITNVNSDARKSGPTVIEKICATVESLLDYHYSAVWDMAFQIVSTMFDKLGTYSSYFMRGALKNLADMQNLPDEDFPYRKQLHECVGSAVGSMGPETFLCLLPLKLEASDLSEVNVWLFPILKQYIIGARLNFFMEKLLGMAKLIGQKSRKFELEGRVFSSRSADALVYSLWSLLPSFCNYPVDTAESFMDLAGVLCSALHEENDIRGIICSSLQNLIQQNKKTLEGKNDLSNVVISTASQRAMAHYTTKVATDNLNVLKSSARELLSILSRIFLESAKDEGGCLQSTIGDFASIADKEIVTRLFKRTMHRLLEATQEAGKTKSTRKSNSMQIDDSSNESSPDFMRARLFDLALSLLPGLNGKEIDVLFVAIKPALQDDSEQRRSYILSSFLTEIILALKEANKRTRNRAYDVLVQIGRAFGDEENGGGKENLYQFFNMVAGGLAGESPHMISAAVKGLARLAYEFSDLVSNVYKLLPSTFLLLQRKNREIIKANLGLLKVLVAKSHAEGLQIHLASMVEGLLKWQDDTKNQFKSKIKLLLEMLVKKCGLDAVKAVMPEEHMKLLKNIRKIKERKERKLATKTEDTKSHFSKTTTSRLSRWNHTKIFSDFGDEGSEGSDAEYMDVGTVSGQGSKASSQLKSKVSTLRLKKKRKADKILPEDLFDQLEDEPLDLLDRQKTRSALRSSEHLKQKTESDDEPEIDSEGRLIIHEGRKPKKVKPSNPDLDGRSEAGSMMSRPSSRKTQKRRKTSESGWAYTGSEYASKKASGDVKRKGKLEPYAYWPMDRKLMSRRPEHRAAARKGMASVVKLTKKLEGKSASSALSMKFTKSKKGRR
ncbi:hypothetical protein CUMW_085060 [Citrus unshiu]|nr:hypothetical protein CUMW_085060 [Citrus unshiu]